MPVITAIDDLNLLARAEPLKALAMTVLLFSLTGVPPMLGFFAKFGVLKAAVDVQMGWLSVLGVIEVVLTFFFLMVILGSTSSQAPAGFAPIAIGLALTLIHLISIPVTNTSVNPARSTGPALFAGGAYVSQLWLFWLAPIAGAVLAGVAGQMLFRVNDQTLPRALSALPEKTPIA